MKFPWFHAALTTRIVAVLAVAVHAVAMFAVVMPAVVAVSFEANARPMVPAEKRYLPYLGRLPLCDNADVLNKISSRFSSTESEYWQSGLEIVGYNGVAEIGNRTIGLDYIPRRYCIARATFNSGAVSTVSYAIAEDLGLIGFQGWGVEWCVEGLDRERSSAPGCKMKRP